MEEEEELLLFLSQSREREGKTDELILLQLRRGLPRRRFKAASSGDGGQW